MSVPMIIDAKMPAITELVNGFVSIIKNNNDTKIALAQIDAMLQTKLKSMDIQLTKDITIIKEFSSMIDKELSKNGIADEKRLVLIDRFIDAILEVGGYK